MKRWGLLLTALLLFSACHRNCKQKQEDSVPVTQPVSVIADTTLQQPSDTVSPTAQRPVAHTAQQDSAEIVNLRISARKQRVVYNPALLEGEWVHGTEHEVYMSDGRGRMWDDSDDVGRGEAQRFEWGLDSNLLTIVCRLELGGVLPKRYVVTFVDDETLVYRDVYGNSYMWDKKN